MDVVTYPYQNKSKIMFTKGAPDQYSRCYYLSNTMSSRILRQPIDPVYPELFISAGVNAYCDQAGK